MPTLRARLLILGIAGVTLVFAGALAVFAVKHVHSFLAVNDPVEGGALVVEGWAPDYALAEAVGEFKRHPYEKLYVTGGTLERGVPLSEYRTYAQLGEAILLRLGMERAFVQAVPAQAVRRDRTYVSALALRELLLREGRSPARINLITLGAHARRSRLLFEKAFGPGTQVGIIAIEDQNYDPAQWWKYSQGVRTVIGELIAYGYARLLFGLGVSM